MGAIYFAHRSNSVVSFSFTGLTTFTGSTGAEKLRSLNTFTAASIINAQAVDRILTVLDIPATARTRDQLLGVLSGNQSYGSVDWCRSGVEEVCREIRSYLLDALNRGCTKRYGDSSFGFLCLENSNTGHHLVACLSADYEGIQ